MRIYSTLSSGTATTLLNGPLVVNVVDLNVLRSKWYHSNNRSLRVGAILSPHPHFTWWCFCKLLQTLNFNMQNSSECFRNWMGVMCCDGNRYRYPYFGTVHSQPPPSPLHARSAITGYALDFTWGSSVQHDHSPGLQEQWSCQEGCELHTGWFGHCSAWMLVLCICTVPQHWGLQHSWHGGSSCALPQSSWACSTLANSSTKQGFSSFSFN